LGNGPFLGDKERRAKHQEQRQEGVQASGGYQTFLMQSRHEVSILGPGQGKYFSRRKNSSEKPSRFQVELDGKIAFEICNEVWERGQTFIPDLVERALHGPIHGGVA